MNDMYIWTKSNVLSKEFCQHVIDKFEIDPNKTEGRMGRGRMDPSIKKSTDLYLHDSLSWSDNWKEEIDTFYQSLSQSLSEYGEFVIEENKKVGVDYIPHYMFLETHDGGYQIQRTKVEEYYHWHGDDYCDEHSMRIITYIWYLNDVEEGGHTQFHTGISIKPEQGKILLFPSTWCYPHRGCPPVSNTKYIVTGWLYQKHPHLCNL